MARNVKSDKSKKDKGLHERVVVLMNSEQHAWLQAQSERTGAPLAHIVRQAVAEYRQRLTKKAAKPSRLMEHSADLDAPPSTEVCPACGGERGRKRTCLVCKGTGRAAAVAAPPSDTAAPF